LLADLYYSIFMPPKRSAKARSRRAIRIAVVDTDPLRLVGFRTLLEGEGNLIFQGCSPSSIFTTHGYDVVLIGSRIGSEMYEVMTGLKSLNPSVRIIATGNSGSDEMGLRALQAGAKGYLEESASAREFKQAIRAVHGGSVWARPQLLSKFIERVTFVPRPPVEEQSLVFTEREREVLHLLVSGRSNREIGEVLGIEERTVKMHVASLMRKAGVSNRIALSVHALTHSLLGAGKLE
jgi:DNA-binding NarL/FixJ family response regulator